MRRVERVILREIRLPLKEPFVISSGVQDLRRILLLQLIDKEGVVGWSECVAQEHPNYSSETIDTAWHALREWLVPAFLSDPAGHPSEVFFRLDATVRGHRMAKGALEMACWHMEAERRKISLSQLLGGTQREIPVGISVGLQSDVSVLLDKIATYVADGYRRIKLKIKPGKDHDVLAAVRRELGDDLPLSVDANSAYRLSDLGHLRAFDAFDLLMLEQPLQHDDLVRHAQLQRELRTPICLDESISSLERAEDMIELGSGRIINIKPGRVGGFAQAMAIHDLCRDKGVPVWCGGMLESGIGRAHNVALASLPNFTLPGDLSPSKRYWDEDIVDPEWTMSDDGMVAVPHDRVGLGVEVDVQRIEALTHRKEEL